MLTAIHPEADDDIDAIRAVNVAAFGQAAEADLVDALRSSGDVLLSLVACPGDGDDVVGHILFSRVTIGREHADPIPAVALAPMAVLPWWQKQGVGSQLVVAGLDQLRERGERIVIVLGHPPFYPRFGFSAALARPLQSAYSNAGDAWMALELVPGALTDVHGVVTYPAAFAGV